MPSKTFALCVLLGCAQVANGRHHYKSDHKHKKTAEPVELPAYLSIPAPPAPHQYDPIDISTQPPPAPATFEVMESSESSAHHRKLLRSSDYVFTTDYVAAPAPATSSSSTDAKVVIDLEQLENDKIAAEIFLTKEAAHLMQIANVTIQQVAEKAEDFVKTRADRIVPVVQLAQDLFLNEKMHITVSPDESVYGFEMDTRDTTENAEVVEEQLLDAIEQVEAAYENEVKQI